MRNTRGLVALGLFALVLCGRVALADYTALAINKNAGNSADNFTDGTFASFQRTSVVAINTSNTTSFTTRYSFVDGTDTGIFTSQSNSLTSDYRINFNVTAPGAYILNVTTHRNGALTLVDDGSASASAAISGVAGTQTGGSLSGSLSLADPPDVSSNRPTASSTRATSRRRSPAPATALRSRTSWIFPGPRAAAAAAGSPAATNVPCAVVSRLRTAVRQPAIIRARADARLPTTATSSPSP
jgi:hypothetical protein